jgi:hypothetical protein
MPKDLKGPMKKLRDRAYEKSMKKKGVRKFGDDEFFIPLKLPGMKKGGVSHGDVGGGFGKVYKGKAKDYKPIIPITPPKPKPEGKQYGGEMKNKPIKAMGGMMLAKNLMENSQTARNVASNMGIAPRMLAEKYQKKEDEKMQGMKKGGLTGGRKKLDVNKDGKISGEDFEILRGKKNKMRGGGIAIRGTDFKGVF